MDVGVSYPLRSNVYGCLREIDQAGNLETITTGIVKTGDQSALSENFSTVLEQVKINEKPLFELEELQEAEAAEKLTAGDLTGYYLIDDETISLHVGQAGMSQSLMKNVMDQFYNAQQSLLVKRQNLRALIWHQFYRLLSRKRLFK